MKVLLLILSLTFCSFVYADFDKAQSQLIGTWRINEKMANEEWGEFLSPLLEEWKSKLKGDELKKFQKELAEAKKSEKDKLVKSDKVVKITRDRLFIIENKKITLEGDYILYMSKDKSMLLHVYSLKHEVKRVSEYYKVSFDESYLRIGRAGSFMPEWYSKTE